MREKTFLPLFLFFLLVTCFNTAESQVQGIKWQKSFGGSNSDSATSIQQTSDGGYIVVGYSNSFDGDVTTNKGSFDVWVVKTTSTGSIQWQKTFGGSREDKAHFVRQTTDGGFIIVGPTFSNDGDIVGNHSNNQDFWVIKLSSTGTMQWQKCLGGSGFEVANSVQQTDDGGYIIAGYSQTADGDVTASRGAYDFWVVKISSIGVLQWQKCLGGSLRDEANSIEQTLDGGYIVVGSTLSINGDVTGNNGGKDFWVVKISSTGVLQWQKCLGGSLDDEAKCVKQTLDGGYIVIGNTESNNGDVLGNHGNTDFWIVKLSANGLVQWQKCLGGTSFEIASSVTQTIDSGFIVVGNTKSNNGNVSGNHGAEDSWVVKLSSSGLIQWQKCLGGTSFDVANSVIQTTDSGFVIAGHTKSVDGDISGNLYSSDFWIVKLSPFAPVIDFFTPDSICTNGKIKILGHGFLGVTSVLINGNPVSFFSVDSSTGITAYVGAGSTGFIYVITAFGIATSNSPIVIQSTPSTTFTIPEFVNIYSSPITLNGSPSGGIYSGLGVVGNTFDPTSAGLGKKQITYIYTNGSGCSSSSNASTLVYDTLGTVCTSYDTLITYLTVTDTLKINVNITGVSPPLNTNKVLVYPNPTSEYLYIDCGNYQTMLGYRLKLVNSIGQVVFNQVINQQNYSIDLSILGNRGTFVLYFLDNNQSVKATKVIILQ